MYPAISYRLARARIADLRRRARCDRLARAGTSVPPNAPQQDRNQIPVSYRRAGRQGRFGKQVWTLLHAQVLLDGPAAAGNPGLIEDNYRRFAAGRASR